MKRPQDEWNEEEIDIDDYPIGLPNGMPKPSMEYHLGLINKYLLEKVNHFMS